jgi:hypothetical protein
VIAGVVCCRTAMAQFKVQTKVTADASRCHQDKSEDRKLRRDAEA